MIRSVQPAMAQRDLPELFLLRHGQTEWNLAGRHQGRLDSPLTELGKRQAERQRDLLRDGGAFDRAASVFCSPQGRARATTRIALRGTGREAIADDDLCEVAFGDWEGLTNAEIDARWPDNQRATLDMYAWHFTSPGGETFADVIPRASAFLNRVQGPAIVISHGIILRAIRGLVLGLDQGATYALRGGQGIVFHIAEGTETILE